MKRRFGLAAAFAVAAVVATGTAVALAGDNNSGFKTGQSSILTGVKAGVEITPLLTVGDVLPSHREGRPVRRRRSY